MRTIDDLINQDAAVVAPPHIMTVMDLLEDKVNQVLSRGEAERAAAFMLANGDAEEADINDSWDEITESGSLADVSVLSDSEYWNRAWVKVLGILRQSKQLLTQLQQSKHLPQYREPWVQATLAQIDDFLDQYEAPINRGDGE